MPTSPTADPSARLTVDSPLGPLALAGNGRAVTVLDWGAAGAEAPDPLLREAAAQLAAYFAGRLARFTVPLEPAGSDFQRRVWDAMAAIPYGETRTYGDLAREVGSAARAIGGACGRNPLPILIPCHRVLASGGEGGYSGMGGLDTKRFLLGLERRGRTAP